MKTIRSFLLIAWIVPFLIRPAGAQTPGALTPEAIAALRASLPQDAPSRAMLNAVAANDVRTLALNRSVAVSSDNYFTNKIKTEGITDQKNSGRCWLYAGLNLMRPVAMSALKKKSFEFSQNYLFFYDKLEKANLFLEEIIRTRTRPIEDREVDWLLKNPFPDGGQWNMVLALIEKYGVVPSDVMPETESSGSTGRMNGIVSTLLRKDASILRDLAAQGKPEQDLRDRKTEMLKDVYKILAFHLGVPPASFTWRYEDQDGKASPPETFTPMEFYRKYVNLKLEDYYCLYSVPTQPFNALYQIQFDRDLFDRPNMTFANVDMAAMKALALKSVLAGEPVWFGCDVGKESDSKSGVMRLGMYDYNSIYGVDFSLTKKERVLYQESVPSHAMLIVGVDLAGGKPVKWMVENSWGSKSGKEGYFTMYDSWFDEYNYAVIIHKKFLPKEILDLFQTKAVVLPPWDPMFSMWLN